MSKVAVIGAGHWGKNHIRTLSEIGGLAAVVEADPNLRLKVQYQYPDIPVYEDFQAVLDSDISAVSIVTPAPTHFELAKSALMAGKDVLVEKPMTLNWKEAAELTRVAEQRSRILMVGHMLLYQPAIQWIKTFVEAGKLGELYSVYQERLSLGIVRKAENALWSLGVHDIAVCLYILGSYPEAIRASGQRALQRNVEDDVRVNFEFSKGRQAYLHVSWLWPERRRRMTLVGSKGMLIYDELKQDVTFFDKGVHADLTIWDNGAETVFYGHPEPLRHELQHFLDRIADRQQPLTNGHHATEVIRVLEEASKSLSEGL